MKKTILCLALAAVLSSCMKMNRLDPALLSMRTAVSQLMEKTPNAIGVQGTSTRSGEAIQVVLTYQLSSGAANQQVTFNCNTSGEIAICSQP